jgi:hypothetical protein
MLERVTDFMAHPETVFNLKDSTDQERYIKVLTLFMSGWHIVRLSLSLSIH